MCFFFPWFFFSLLAFSIPPFDKSELNCAFRAFVLHKFLCISFPSLGVRDCLWLVLVLTFCCFVVYSTRRFVVCLSVCHFVLVFFSPFSIAITLLGEERANLSAFRTFVRFVLVWICRFSLPLGGLGRAAVSDCGTPWTFSLSFFLWLWHSMDFFFYLFVCLCWGFTAQSTQWGHIERGQFT